MHSICQRNPVASYDLYLYIKKIFKIPTLDFPVERFQLHGRDAKTALYQVDLLD